MVERDATAEVLRELRVLVVAPNGTRYQPRVCGALAHDGTSHWHGWIEVRTHDSTRSCGTPT